MDESKDEAELQEENRSDVEEIVDGIWESINSKFGPRLSQEDMNSLFAALGVVAGMGLLDGHEVDPLFPYHLQGVMIDFTYQTLFSAKYGIDFAELEFQKEKCH